MKKLAQISPIALALLLFLATPALAIATGTVKGSISGPGGPIAGAHLIVNSSTDSSYTGSTDSDSAGAFSTSNVPVGQIDVKAYDKQGNMLAGATGVLKSQGDTLTLGLTSSH